ncbi:MAG: NAD(P)/FAD-dependent oxidoreductase [Thermodesulfobacteriota bacterium]
MTSVIRIAGSGPAGLTAAINLARGGCRVEVFEKRPDSGRRFCGDLQGLDNWSVAGDIPDQLREMGLTINFDCTPFSGLTVTNGARVWQFATPRPAFFLVKRGSATGCLDQGLKEQALAQGVTIRYNTPLAEEEADIVATGPRCRHIFALDKGIVFRTSMADGAFGLVNDRAAFRGYSYLLVVNGYGCMCTVLFDAFADIRQCLAETRRIFADLLPLDIREPRPAGGVGSFTFPSRFQRGKTLFAGEAAGLQDLLWGFGMRSAITSGYLAARSIMTGEDYPQLARRFFERRLKASLVSRYLWERFGHNSYAMIIDRIGGARDPLAFLHSFHNFNWLQRLAYPFALRFCRKRYGRLWTAEPEEADDI